MTFVCLKATDPEDGDFGLVWYRSIAPNQPFSVERDTGNVRANQTFQGKAGMRYEYVIEAYDNRGNNPSLIARQTLTVCQQCTDCFNKCPYCTDMGGKRQPEDHYCDGPWSGFDKSKTRKHYKASRIQTSALCY